jgi:hypothetical protein
MPSFQKSSVITIDAKPGVFWPLMRGVLTLIGGCVLAAQPAAEVRQGAEAYEITTQSRSAVLTAGILRRTLDFDAGVAATTSFAIDGQDCLGASGAGTTFVVSFAKPNQRPHGIKGEEKSRIKTSASQSAGTDSLQVDEFRVQDQTDVTWVHELRIDATTWATHFERPALRVVHPTAGVQRLYITAAAKRGSPLAGMTVTQCFEIYDGFPVIRKWIEHANAGNRWLKLNELLIDDLELAPAFRHPTPLTPSERGAGPSVIAFGTPTGSRGVIAASEVPSALRQVHATGAMGYSTELFEWVLGPGEQFVSEPVYVMAYSGDVVTTLSGISTPRDRAVEGLHVDFLRKHVGVAADHGPIDAPQWCSWSNFGQQINDAIIREQATIAGRCGFALMLLDQGWQMDLVGTQPDTGKFPDFEATARHIRSQWLKLGLWVSCYRHPDSPDMLAMPEARSVPLRVRDEGFGMSFASPWRKFYAADLAALSRKFGASYFKQDFTNIKFGDSAATHESRTRNESLLRGLRGLLEAQDLLRTAVPGVMVQLTHEIYWGTPGVPCDLAVLKHAASYHIPPNDYSGAGERKRRFSENWTADPGKLRQQLIRGCYNARRRFYAHRGLPLYALEYYAAHSVNFRGSLTAGIQDRQVCSWLMGAPRVFAGDLTSLTDENIRHYRARFDLLARLEKDHGMYRNFQYSGVPEPTDTEWHWWGKLNHAGAGVVVVIRGSQGADTRAVNIPWVQADRSYHVSALLGEKALGTWSGRDLQDGKLHLQLPPVGQEILEIKLDR